MRILFVPGIKTPPSYLRGWRRELQEQYSECADVHILDEIFYWYVQHEVMEQIITKGVKILSDATPTLIIAHSFGGILAKAMISRSDTANIQQFISLATPHHLNYMGVKKAKNKIHAPLSIEKNVSCFSFGGYFDPIVPFLYTRMGNENHKNLWCEHLAFLFSSRVRKRVLTEVSCLS